MADIQHNSMVSADVHEPKHITSSSTGDAGKVITPSSSTSGTSELRSLKISELDTTSGDENPFTGWQYWVDTPNSQALTGGNRTKIEIDGAGAASDRTHEPSGASALWDVSNDKILPAADGDSYDIRLDFTINFSTGTNLYYDIDLDIGGGIGIIAQQTVSVPKGTSVDIACTISWPVFVGSTFLSNGGTFYITSSHTASITDKAITIVKTHKAG